LKWSYYSLLTFRKEQYYFIKIIIKDERLETVTVAGYLNLLWQDEFLYWTPSKEGNITEIKTNVNNIWNPGLRQK